MRSLVQRLYNTITIYTNADWNSSFTCVPNALVHYAEPVVVKKQRSERKKIIAGQM
jgi:hypothetical protein